MALVSCCIFIAMPPSPIGVFIFGNGSYHHHHDLCPRNCSKLSTIATRHIIRIFVARGRGRSCLNCPGDTNTHRTATVYVFSFFRFWGNVILLHPSSQNTMTHYSASQSHLFPRKWNIATKPNSKIFYLRWSVCSSTKKRFFSQSHTPNRYPPRRIRHVPCSHHMMSSSSADGSSIWTVGYGMNTRTERRHEHRSTSPFLLKNVSPSSRTLWMISKNTRRCAHQNGVRSDITNLGT